MDLALKHGDKEEYFRGGYQSWVEWRSPSDVCGPQVFSEVLDIVHSPDVILAQTPYEGSVEVVTELTQKHDIFYISNRDERAARATETWLEECGFPDAHLIATMEDKQPFLSECQYIIDDRAKTLVQFVEDYTWKKNNGSLRQRKGFSLMFDYNRALTDVPNIYLAPTWGGIKYFLESKGVL